MTFLRVHKNCDNGVEKTNLETTKATSKASQNLNFSTGEYCNHKDPINTKSLYYLSKKKLRMKILRKTTEQTSMRELLGTKSEKIL